MPEPRCPKCGADATKPDVHLTDATYKKGTAHKDANVFVVCCSNCGAVFGASVPHSVDVQAN